jgi:hypothetical protein
MFIADDRREQGDFSQVRRTFSEKRAWIAAACAVHPPG